MHTAPLPELALLHALCLWAAPILAGVAAWACGLAATPERAWRLAQGAAAAWLGLAAAGALALAKDGGGAGWGVRADVAGAAVLLLVGFVGWVILRFAQTYLAGEARQVHGARWLLATLCGVGMVIVGNHLLVMALAWLATSAALQRLLMFYDHRPAARLAAHKKRVASRMADLFVFTAVTIIGSSTGTFAIDGAMQAAATAPGLGWPLQAAALLMAAAAILKCAQLPFHGWLIQVMEAPTPVSALLHAGVVNLGALVLIRLSPLVGAVPAAQALLLVVGSTTAVVAALVMSTRISVKVMLAWSTCAQLGFMLMQCGLGAYGLALVHLLAHSLYKAHAFLDTGATVQRCNTRRLGPQGGAGTARGALARAVLGMVALGALAWALGSGADAPAASWVLLAIGGASMAPLLMAGTVAPRGPWRVAVVCSVAATAMATLAWHALADAGSRPAQALSPVWLAWVGMAFASLFALQAVLARWPHGRWSRILYPWFYGGLFLDEQVSRLVFKLWPPADPVSPVQPPAAPHTAPWMPPLTTPERPL